MGSWADRKGNLLDVESRESVCLVSQAKKKCIFIDVSFSFKYYGCSGHSANIPNQFEMGSQRKNWNRTPGFPRVHKAKSKYFLLSLFQDKIKKKIPPEFIIPNLPFKE